MVNDKYKKKSRDGVGSKRTQTRVPDRSGDNDRQHAHLYRVFEQQDSYEKASTDASCLVITLDCVLFDPVPSLLYFYNF